MTAHVVVAMVLLAIPAAGPTVALVGVRPVTLFLAPLAGSLVAAVAAEFELAVGGSFLTWFVVLAVLINAVAARRLWRIVRSWSTAEPFASPWPWITLLAVVVALAWPLQSLRNPISGNDGGAARGLGSRFADFIP